MSVRRPRRLGLCTMVLACLGVATFLSAGPPSTKKKAPKASKILVKAAKNLAKVKGYRTSVAVLGGISDRADHKVTQRTVDESYDGIVQRSLMFVSSPKAFRTNVAGKGAVYDGGWKKILGTRKGVLMDRLFVFPQSVLMRAVRYKNTAEWVKAPEQDTEVIEGLPKLAGGDEDEIDEADEEESKEAEADEAEDESKTDSRKKKKSRTAVAKKKTKKSEPVELPGVIRVEAPTKEALRHFNDAVLNSGCLSVG